MSTDSRRPIRRALVSVYDKTGLEDLAKALHGCGVEIVSTGSTAAVIAGAGLPVVEVSQLTGFPECLDGRVKTLHPKVHAGILADLRQADHASQLEELGVQPFDLVVVNLYPFTATVAAGAATDECVEQIDIGGPSMVRAAAKNHPSVAVVTSPERYDQVIRAAKEGGFNLSERQELARDAFIHTADYDVAVATWMSQELAPDDGPAVWRGATYRRLRQLRYGENPHQAAAVYAEVSPGFALSQVSGGQGPPETKPGLKPTRAPADGPLDASSGTGLAGAVQLGGKAMSYNNYQDAEAAWRAALDFDAPAVAVVKHANPCGIAEGACIAEAHAKAHACDSKSAYGGVIAANRPVSLAMAEQVAPVFTEVIVAPDFEAGALEKLQTKKNLRILKLAPTQPPTWETRAVSGGLLVQARDVFQAPGDDPANWRLVAGQAASDQTLADLVFAWKACRAVKSNAILLAADGASVGIGMGQVNRVDSVELAVRRAGAERARGAVAASDAFFPFADGLELLVEAGVTAVVEPGGSIRDAEVIEAAQAAGLSLYFTGSRHFFH
ncbi:MAG: bifunctional phosphoribosylaminoimidazolecarboxamide formyltransferase/inosine monophosphate cyclohydrolase [Micrococcales bacterium]|nr:bifunctional phosphoribosylaminoimidazolecarboxamide formyltransferase/inosine monophosphate cyclohydrolase [Micrococcales bacterium]